MMNRSYRSILAKRAISKQGKSGHLRAVSDAEAGRALLEEHRRRLAPLASACCAEVAQRRTQCIITRHNNTSAINP